MAKWVSQQKTASTSANARSRVKHLDPVREEAVQAIRDYYAAHPDGEEVTVAVLAKLGRERLIQLSGGVGKLDAAKQDVGRLVPILLVELYGADRVTTLREDNGRSVSTRAVKHPEVNWATRYTPHRVMPAGESWRIVLDTNAVRNVVQGASDPTQVLDLDALAQLKGKHTVSISDPTFVELLVQLLRGSIPWTQWSERAPLLEKVLDPNLPFLPGGRELANMAGLTHDLALVGMDKDGGYDQAQSEAYSQAVWRFLSKAKGPADFQKSLVYSAPNGQRFKIGPIDVSKPDELVHARGSGWMGYLGRMVHLARHSGRTWTADELRAEYLSAFKVEYPPAAADRLGLLADVLTNFTAKAINHPDYKPKPNDSMDFEVLFATVLPAVVCTSDVKMRKAARESLSSDGKLVMNPLELVAWLKAGGAPHNMP